MIELNLLTGCDTSMKTTTRICAATAGITAIDERKYSERSISGSYHLAARDENGRGP